MVEPNDGVGLSIRLVDDGSRRRFIGGLAEPPRDRVAHALGRLVIGFCWQLLDHQAVISRKRAVVQTAVIVCCPLKRFRDHVRFSVFRSISHRDEVRDGDGRQDADDDEDDHELDQRETTAVTLRHGDAPSNMG